MPELLIYKTTAEFPPHFYYQMEAFVRMVWADGDSFDIEWGWQHEDVHFVVASGKKLISYASVVWVDVDLNGETYKCGGLGSVMTFPAFRRKGFGGQVVKAATDYIMAESAVDIALLWTEHEGFYERYGWQNMPNLKTQFGNPDNPVAHDEEMRMMLFVSEKAKSHRPDFEQGTIYVGEETW